MKHLTALFLAILLCTGVTAQNDEAALPAGHADTQKIEWLTWDEMVGKMKEEPRKVMVDVYTDWCGWCKRMDATTMKDPTVIQMVNDQYYAVKLDGEHKEDIEFRGRTFKFVAKGRRGYHELPAELMNGRMSYPTIVFLDEEYNIIQPLPGYKQPRDLEMILAYFGGDFYKETAWEKFQQQYKSPNEQ